ncbi:MAG: hypothetical protein ACE19N_00340 [Candidatus Karelsulcia muelleri]
MSLKDAKNLKLKNCNVYMVIKDIPVYIQPGQAIVTIGLSF